MPRLPLMGKRHGQPSVAHPFPPIAWTSLRLAHSRLENASRFPQVHNPDYDDRYHLSVTYVLTLMCYPCPDCTFSSYSLQLTAYSFILL